MATSDLNARQWTHVDALALAVVRDVKAHASLMDLSVLGSLASGSAQAGCGNLPVSQVVRRLAPVGFAFQGTSAPVVVSPAALQRIETEAVAPIAVERQGTTVLVETLLVETLRVEGLRVAAVRNYKSISADPRPVFTGPVTTKGRKSGVPPRGRPEEKG